jgi:LPXTG-motif cell wall-anchored protein
VPASSGAEESDQAREANAYNNSIYLMVGVPYVLLGGVGFMVYRSRRKAGGPGD